MTTISLRDRVPVTGLRRDSAGNLIGVARAARTGIQIYAGYEVGRPDLARVRVYRPPEEVFAKDSMRTFASAPVTIEHPGEDVTPENWKDHAIGETENDNIVKDGEVVKVPFMVRDAGGIAAIEDGKHEVSMGYGCILDFQSGTVPAGQRDEGEAYDAVQRTIRINHLAIVDKARGGSELRIGDSEDRSKTMATKTIMVDGLQVEVTDAAEAAIRKLEGRITAADATVAERDKTITAKDAEIEKLKGEKVALEQKVKDAEDAAKPEKLAELAAARATLIADAKRLDPKIVTDGKSDAEIRKAALTAKVGDEKVAAMSDAQIEGAFACLVPPAGKNDNGGGSGATGANDAVTSIIAEGTSSSLDDAVAARDKARAARSARFANYGREPEKAKA